MWLVCIMSADTPFGACSRCCLIRVFRVWHQAGNGLGRLLLSGYKPEEMYAARARLDEVTQENIATLPELRSCMLPGSVKSLGEKAGGRALHAVTIHIVLKGRRGVVSVPASSNHSLPRELQ